MRRFLVVFALFAALIFVVSCGGDSKKEENTKPDNDTNDTEISDTGISDKDSDNPQEPDGDSDDIDISDIEIPDEDSDTPDNPEVTENHKISGILQAGSAVSGVHAALVECGKTEEIVSANTDANGKFSFNADISADKTYCVKAGDFASCFKGMSDHIANISEITTAAYLLDENCTDLRKSETKVRTYAKLGTGIWLGELDYSKLSGISEGIRLLSSFLDTTDSKTLSQKIAADIQKTDGRGFYKFFNGFKITANKKEVVINTADPDSNEVSLNIEGGSNEIAAGFKIVWTALNKTAESATHKFKSVEPGEYTVLAKLVDDGGDPIMISEDSSTILFLLEKISGTIDVSDMSKDISHYIDHGIYVVIPKNTVIKKGNTKVNTLTYTIMMTGGGSQISKIDFGPEGTTFTGDELYFVYELGTVFGGDPIMLSAARSNGEVLQSAGGDPIMLAAGGDPIMFSAAGDPIMQIARSAGGDPIMQSAAGDPIMTNAAGDPIMTSAAGDPIMNAAAGDPIMTNAAGDPIMSTAAGDPIMMGTSSSVMIAKTGHFSGFMLNSNSLPISVEVLLDKWCGDYYYKGYSPLVFIKQGVEKYKPAGDDKNELLSYLECQKIGRLESDLYELVNKQIGYQRNLNLLENLYYVSEFYNRMIAKKENGEFAAAKNGLELRSAIAALYTATTSFNRSSTLEEMFESSNIPITYNGTAPEDYSLFAQKTLTGLSEINEKYVATKKEMMIFANYITTSSKGPDFSGISSALTPDQFVCAWLTGTAESCDKVYTLNENGHVALNGSEIPVADAESVFAKYFMPMNSRLSNSEKLNLFRTFYLVLRYSGTVFNGANLEELNDKLLKTAYLVFDGINKNKNAVTIVDTFDASANTVQVLESGSMDTKPYLNKLSSLTDLISLNVATAANVEKVLIKIEGREFDKVTENTRTYYKPKGEIKEQSIILTPGALEAGLKPLKELIGPNNVDTLGNITGKMTVVVNSKISGKTYSTQKTYEFLVNDKSDGVDSKPVPSNLSVLVNDATGHAIALENNPGIILNPGNKTFYPDESGEIKITNLAPASYTITAFADGYYTKNAGVNLPENATLGVEIRLDEEITSSHAEANLTLKVNIATVKHPAKVYIQIYDENMELVANESARFNETSNGYDDVNIGINFGRYTLLAVAEEMYNYLEAITVNDENTVKEITVVAKNACGNGIIDAGEECETGDLDSTEVLCRDIFHASTNPENKAVCNKTTCVYDKAACGAQTYSNCGDGIIDPGEGCDGGSKACSEIGSMGASAKGSAPCADNCSDWIIADNCSRTVSECGNEEDEEKLPANAVWNDGTGRFSQTYDGEKWIPENKEGFYGTTREECAFSCIKGYKWESMTQQCIADPLSLGNICTGQTTCSDNSSTTACPVYGSSFFGQDSQYAAVKYCTQKSFSQKEFGEETVVVDNLTHFVWQKVSSESAMSWVDADTYCMRFDQSGETEWRLPTPAELLTIVDGDRANPVLVDNFVISGNTFWTAQDTGNSANAWRLGEVGEIESVEKTENNFVVCIRDYTKDTLSFTQNSDETVTDGESGLIWQKNPASSKNWREALEYCESLTAAGHYDWRLPNRNELASLIDFAKTDGAMSSFPGIAQNKFWTSTSSVTEATKAWAVDFADGSITAETKSDTNYVLCVRSENVCLGDESECVDACDFEPCRNTANSTGVCTATGGTFYCGCKSGFEWNSANAKCIQAITQYASCSGLPENAKWNTVPGISQIWNGDEWYPDTTGEYNETASTKECRFICDGYFEWDADLSRCVNKTQLVSCGILPYANTEWTGTDSIIQTWNGEEWLPKADLIQSDEAAENECRFKCKEYFNWNAENSNCDPATQVADCTEHPENALWNTVSQITQTWNGEEWLPSNESVYSQTPSNSRCYFKCKENHEWLRDKCSPKKQPAYCVIPEHTVNNTAATIIQTWNEAEYSWEPSEIAEYNETPSTQDCRYICENGYFWNGSVCVNPCDADPCSAIENATDTCTPLALNVYECGCENGYFWDDMHCKRQSGIGSLCTGQNECYNSSSRTYCPQQGGDYFGQDAQCAAWGFCTPHNLTSGTVVENETTLFDKNTGLEWRRGILALANSWASAVTYCENLEYAGKDDWRLPTPEEFLTIVDKSKYLSAMAFPGQIIEPSYDANYFSDYALINNLIFWTSKKYAYDPTKAWWIHFYLGTTGTDSISVSKNVLCVRGKEFLTAPVFTVSSVGSDEIVTDATTGLVWQKEFTSSINWNDALAYCQNLIYAGFTDWRLPNLNELASLISYDRIEPASKFPGMQSDWQNYYWTSSTNILGSSDALAVNFAAGSIESSDKSGVNFFYHARCVRSDICGEGEFWDGTACTPNPCASNSCGNAEHAQCIPTSAEDYYCTCDNAKNGYFWTGSECVSPCDTNPCGNLENSKCISQSAEEYTCECDMRKGYVFDGTTCVEPCASNPCGTDERVKCSAFPPYGYYCYCTGGGYFYDGSGCVNPCDTNPCGSDPHSTGNCSSASATTYSCGCNDGYFWNGTECINPCDANTCTAEHSVCISQSANEYTCGCENGYAWNGSQCIVPIGNICTGQTKCYNTESYGEITCPAEGEDFYGQDAQYAALGKCTPQSFTVKTILGNNVVFDNNTGLQWQQAFSENTFSWDDAVTHCENLTYGGYSDWRLPNHVELLTISNGSRSYPAFDTTYFPNITDSVSSKFWTSQERKADTTKAYFVFHRDVDAYDTAKTDECNVMCVRGEKLPAAKFRSSEIGSNIVVSDSTTGLMWQKDYSSTKTWQEALSYCENLEYAGYSDWRLPNRNESAMLLNYDKTASHYSDFPDMPANYFWSSSTKLTPYSTSAWCVDYGDGTLSGSFKDLERYVRCVRSE